MTDRNARLSRLVLLYMITAITVVAVSSCRTTMITIETPTGFARYSGYSGAATGDNRAISPEGVVLRIRTEKNDPPQNLAFWTEALKNHLEQSGYKLLGEEEFDSEVGPGVLFEWIAPVDQEDWVYLTAIAVVDERIAIVEAAGPYAFYRDYEQAIKRSLATVNEQQQ